jgi:hypothetical protein
VRDVSVRNAHHHVESRIILKWTYYATGGTVLMTVAYIRLGCRWGNMFEWMNDTLEHKKLAVTLLVKTSSAFMEAATVLGRLHPKPA